MSYSAEDAARWDLDAPGNCQEVWGISCRTILLFNTMETVEPFLQGFNLFLSTFVSVCLVIWALYATIIVHKKFRCFHAQLILAYVVLTCAIFHVLYSLSVIPWAGQFTSIKCLSVFGGVLSAMLFSLVRLCVVMVLVIQALWYISLMDKNVSGTGKIVTGFRRNCLIAILLVSFLFQLIAPFSARMFPGSTLTVFGIFLALFYNWFTLGVISTSAFATVNLVQALSGTTSGGQEWRKKALATVTRYQTLIIIFFSIHEVLEWSAAVLLQHIDGERHLSTPCVLIVPISLTIKLFAVAVFPLLPVVTKSKSNDEVTSSTDSSSSVVDSLYDSDSSSSSSSGSSSVELSEI
jgi:hypothetical protein